VKAARSLLTLAGLLGAAVAAAGPTDWAVAVFPSGAGFVLEVAAEPAKRQLGYMYREEVGPHEGMIFLFDAPGRHGIWMKNCKVALDIIWLDEDLRVVEIAAEQPPCPESGPCPTAVPMRAARYVLEVAAGVAAREQLAPGDRLVFLEQRASR
jgi:uncharacterized membrane protein (UPF0127 family)